MGDTGVGKEDLLEKYFNSVRSVYYKGALGGFRKINFNI
jgi:hypothetical protein